MPSSKKGYNPPRLEVPQGEWRHLEDEGVLYTKSIDTCVGLSIYDPAQHLGFLGHFDRSSVSEDNRYAMLSRVSRAMPGAKAIVWVGGANIITPNSAPDTWLRNIEIANEEARWLAEKILSSIAELPLQEPAITDDILQNRTTLMSYTLDVRTGDSQVIHTAKP